MTEDKQSAEPGTIQANGISRRTVTKAMAWAVPVIAVASTVPGAAASVTCLSSGVCFGGIRIEKYCAGSIPTGREYWACVSFTNNSQTQVNVSFDFVLVTSANGNLTFTGGGSVAAGDTGCFLVEVQPTSGADNCSAGSYAGFNLNFSDGTNSGTQAVPGGATKGNVAPECVC